MRKFYNKREGLSVAYYAERRNERVTDLIVCINATFKSFLKSSKPLQTTHMGAHTRCVDAFDPRLKCRTSVFQATLDVLSQRHDGFPNGYKGYF
jgi:hypothetical protein